ncbi:hypothetical protein FA95DRAFT_1581585 [Auriscalpium vulgare]|uniref:Uncharacterized protein n=1 Tax=Auriscalpium vulgare TaxID=40419 RepID=A0ACB8S1E3_9AGAM|nr:hypothetical protein FA95DRAFT_1581585 [Auriscalpium vulgare]
MGASHSKSDADSGEQVFYNDVPIQISGDLVHQLSDPSASPDVSPARQAALDAGVVSHIHAQAARLASEEEDVRQQIEAALERENLDRERTMAGGAAAAEDGEDTVGEVKSSAVLLGDLEEVRQRVDRYTERRKVAEGLDSVAQASKAVVSCLEANPGRSLNCHSEVSAFHSAVADVEQKYVQSLR